MRFIPIFVCILVLASSCRKKDFHKVPTYGVQLYYSFDGNTLDIGPYANHGIDSTAGVYVSGRFGKALNFDGNNDFVKLTETLNSENGLTFSFWVMSRGAATNENNGAIISKYNMTGHIRCFLISSFGANDTRSDNRLSAVFYQEGIYPVLVHDHVKSYLEPSELQVFPDPSMWDIINPVRLPLNEWVHCVVNMTDEYLEVWLNADLCARKKREHQNYYQDMDEPTYIGNIINGGSGSNNHFNGALDDFLVYNRPLTRDEIHMLYRGD
jgi:hypothetical protein